MCNLKDSDPIISKYHSQMTLLPSVKRWFHTIDGVEVIVSIGWVASLSNVQWKHV